MSRPNIIVIMSDQFKATASHLWGNTFLETPSLERLANEGVRFDCACTPHPLCVPARVSLWTSQYPHSHGSRRNETLMRADRRHAWELWKEQGYHIGLIGKNHCFDQPNHLAMFDTWCEITHPGLIEGVETKGMDWVRPIESIMRAHTVRRNMPFVNPQFSYAVTDYPLEDYSTGLIAAQTTAFLEEHTAQEDAEPFALWVSIPDPHEPYETPRKYFDMLPPDKIDLFPSRDGEMMGDEVPERNKVLYQILGCEDNPDDDMYGFMASYYGNVRFLDDAVGQILDTLERLDLREETIVVFCADHGDMAGEHNMITKGGVFYDALTRVPMIVSWPGMVGQGLVDDTPVNLIDIVPTILSLQEWDIPRYMQGRPMPTATNAAPRVATFSEYGCGGPQFTREHLNQLPETTGYRALIRSLQWREAEGRRKMVRTQGWKYVHDSMFDLDELYDLRADPWELTNLAQDANTADVTHDMQLLLANWMMDTEDAVPVPLPEAVKYDLRQM